MLAKYGNVEYSYDGNGIRTGKKSGTYSEVYKVDGDRILERKDGNSRTFKYLYNETGICGMIYIVSAGYMVYYFKKNIFGDVTEIYTPSLSNYPTLVCSYRYDAFGNCTAVKSAADSNDITNLNPIRWRGYFYDAESGFYLIGNRYYDPEFGRFINADDPESLIENSTDLEGLNAYSIGIGHMDMPASYFDYLPNTPLMTHREIVSGTRTSRASKVLRGIGRVLTGVFAVVAGIGVIASGLAGIGMLIVAGITIVAGAATIVNGAADIGEGFTGYNFMRDGLFGGNQTAYNWYSGITEAAAIVGSMICGGWLKANKQRILAYKKFKNYKGDKIVIGEGMKRVIKMADKTGAQYYEGLHFYTDLAKISPELAKQAGLMHNGLWLLGQTSKGVHILDIGIKTGTSINFAMERALLAAIEYQHILII